MIQSWPFRLVGLGVFPVVADRVHQRFVRHDEKYRWILGSIFMAMEIPERDHEGVALFPLVDLIADRRDAASSPYVVNS